MLLVERRQGVDRADGEGVGTTLCGAARQLLQGQAVAVAAITWAAQAVKLRRNAPAARWGLFDSVLQAVATQRRHGHCESTAIDSDAVIAQGQCAR
ncbi:hypothetical protein D3C81_973510 [compost metagenome]